MKQKRTTKNKTKTNQNHIVWKSAMVLIILLIIFLISGCSSSSSSSTEETAAPTYSLKKFSVDNTLVLSKFEYKNNADMPESNVAVDSGTISSVTTNVNVYSLTLPLTDLGINSTKTIDLSVEVEAQ